jgi:hypothetical protein
MALLDDKKGKFSQLKLFLADVKPILLSHHPNCEMFSNHVYHLGKYKLCIGCFTFYPVLILTFTIITMFLELNINNLVLLFYLSFLFFLPLILNIIGLTKYKFLKIFSKVAIGIGTGFQVTFIIYFPYFNIIMKILFLLDINMVIGVIAYIRGNHIKKDCLECEFEGDWSTCPGMKPITEKLYEHGFKKKRSNL